MATMRNKPVSFNMDNEEDRKQYEHIKDIKNFSGFMKSLIDKEIKFPDEKHAPGEGITIKGGVVKSQ